MIGVRIWDTLHEPISTVSLRQRKVALLLNGELSRLKSVNNEEGCVNEKSLLKFLSEGFCGERGIRTPGTSRYDGFQDRCNRPLYHLSKFGRMTIAWFS